jgi:hypothetical protein
VKPVVVCGREMWPMTEMDMRRLNTSVMEILRRIYRPVVEQEIGRITATQQLRELCKDLGIIIDTTRKDWDGLGIW